MGIHRNTTYSGTSGVTWLEFGDGSILMVGSHPVTSEHEAVLFKTINSGEIDRIVDPDLAGKPSAEFEPEVIMTFTDPKSIDVLIEKLREAKTHLLKTINDKP